VRDLVANRRHNEELYARGRPDWDTVRGFVVFAQHRYDVSQGWLRQAIQNEADAAQENEKLRAELQSFGDQSRSRSRGLRRPRSPSRSCSPRPLSRRSRSRDRRSRSRGHSPHGHRPTENNLFRSMDY
jgi:hypothetical protein